MSNSTHIQLLFVHACRSQDAFSGYFQYRFPQELQFHIMRSKYICFRLYCKMLHLDRIPLCLMAYAVYRALITLYHCQLENPNTTTTLIKTSTGFNRIICSKAQLRTSKTPVISLHAVRCSHYTLLSNQI